MRLARFLIAVCALSCTASSLAGQYTFSTIYRSDPGPLVMPAISNSGIIAYMPEDGTIVTTDGITSTTIASPSERYRAWAAQILSVNDDGVVAFLGVDSQSSSNPEVLASDGSTVLVIATPESFDEIEAPEFQRWLSINDNRVVAFAARTEIIGPPASGAFLHIYVGDGLGDPVLMSPVDRHSTCAAINNSGLIGYRYMFAPGFHNAAIESSPPNTSPDVTFQGIVSYSPVDINDSGVVAFMGSYSSVTASDGVSDRVVDLSSYYGSQGFTLDLADPGLAINNNGDLAFGATRREEPFPYTYKYGVFTGADPIGDKVIETGDSLDGAKVTRPLFGREGFNDLGQIAFWAELDDGTSGIFVATPIPEPSVSVLLIMGGLIVSAYAYCRRRR